MASKTGVGGVARIYIYAIVAGAFATTPLIIFDKVNGFTRTGHPKKKNVKLNFTAYQDDDEITEHLEEYLSAEAAAAKTINEVEFDDGETEGGGPASTSETPTFGVVAFETKQGGKVKTTTIIGTYTGATGDVKTAARTKNSTVIEISAVEVEEDTDTPAGCFPASIVTAAGADPAPTQLDVGTFGDIRRITAP